MTKTFLGQKKSMWIQPSGSKLVPWWDGSGNVNNENIEGPVFVLEEPEIIQWFLGKKKLPKYEQQVPKCWKTHTVFVWLLNMFCCYWLLPSFFWGTIIHQKPAEPKTHSNTNHGTSIIITSLSCVHSLPRRMTSGLSGWKKVWSRWGHQHRMLSCIDESPYIKLYMHIYYYVCI